MYRIDDRTTEIVRADLCPQPRSDLNHLCWPCNGTRVYVSRIPCTVSTGGHPCLVAAGRCPVAWRDSQAGELHDRARAAGASGGQLTRGGEGRTIFGVRAGDLAHAS